MTRRSIVLAVAALAAPLMLSGCASPTRGNAVPFELQDRAVVTGLGPSVRTWGGEINPDFGASLPKIVARERDALRMAPDDVNFPRADYLALSGGGSNGAFGAGLLCGWTAKGDRPDFKIVTGISTGALIAPFAFLGAEYDEAMKTLYTKTTTRDLLRSRGMLAALYSDALADTKPMRDLLATQVHEKMLADIAREYRKGRLLFIGTTNLDARRAVLWNIGEIAERGGPEALDLIRKILIASASIPAAFPPVMIDVEADGAKYQEMHVDGGAMTQVFIYPPSLHIDKAARAGGVVRERRAYIIRNARLDPDWAEVDRRALTIAGRAISSLIQTQGMGDLYRIFVTAQRDRVDFNLAFIPSSFTVKSHEEFDPVYMTALFQVGYDMALAGYPWQKTPPFYEAPPPADPAK